MKDYTKPGSSIYRESLRTLVLRILAEEPTHGYNIIRKVEEITEGKWRPAAGTLYPLLDQMKQEGLITVREISTGRVRGGKRVVYELTDEGWKKLAEILLEKSKAKVDIVHYLIVKGASLLRKSGYNEEADKICSILSKVIDELVKEIKTNCK